MLRISRKADYSVFLLGAIARRGAYPGGRAEDEVVSAQEVANEAGLSKPVVANLLKEFAKDGILDSVRGLRGGYRLTRTPGEISLGRILEVVDGPFSLIDCARPTHFGGEDTDEDPPPTCSLLSFCPSKSSLRLVHDRFARILEEIRLDELCGMTAPCRSPAPSLAAR